MPQVLKPDALQAKIATVPGWRVQDGVLARSYQFASFSAAFAFMTRVALLAEQAKHHPDWRNVYNRVDIRLSTHDAGGLTDKDFALATAIDAL